MANKKTPKRRGTSRNEKSKSSKKASQGRTVRAAPEPLEAAPFIFRGTVLQLNSVTFAEVLADADTIVVHVDQIIESPDILRDFEGQDITVKLSQDQHVEENKTYVFRATGWIFGTGLALRCISVEEGDEAQMHSAAEEVQAGQLAKTRARAQRAELVVAGQVAQVRTVSRPVGQPITEHDPLWCEATVSVHDVARGKRKSAAARQVVVRFAGSRDVKWVKSPKFNVGDKGLWMLGDKSKDHVAIRAAAAVPKEQYLVLDAADFVPEEHAEAVLAQIKERE